MTSQAGLFNKACLCRLIFFWNKILKLKARQQPVAVINHWPKPLYFISIIVNTDISFKVLNNPLELMLLFSLRPRDWGVGGSTGLFCVTLDVCH